MHYSEITTVEQALAQKGLTLEMVAAMHSHLPEEYRASRARSFALDVTEDVLNQETPIDWSNTSQRKWRHWWNIETGSSSVGLSLDDCAYDYSSAVVGARRSFASEEIAQHAAEHFRPEYEKEFFEK